MSKQNVLAGTMQEIQELKNVSETILLYMYQQQQLIMTRKRIPMKLNREVKALSRCRHKNIVQLIGACSNPPMLVLAYASQGTLRDLLRNDNTFG